MSSMSSSTIVGITDSGGGVVGGGGAGGVAGGGIVVVGEGVVGDRGGGVGVGVVVMGGFSAFSFVFFCVFVFWGVWSGSAGFSASSVARTGLGGISRVVFPSRSSSFSATVLCCRSSIPIRLGSSSIDGILLSTGFTNGSFNGKIVFTMPTPQFGHPI